jgi:RNA polymerase sigma-70 factor (ECF subfamily)
MHEERDLSDLPASVLVRLAQAGDEAAYGHLHARLNERLLRGLRLSFTAELAEDAAQEAWIRAYERLGDLDSPDSFFAWLATIARNSAKSILRAPEQRTIYLAGSEVQVDPTADPYEAAVLREREEAARSALARLPQRQRRALRLRWIDGWSYRAIANLTGQSVSAIETLLYRARSNFHRQYESALSGMEAPDGVACYKMRSHIRGLGEGTLSERRRTRVLTHLSQCARCRNVHEQMGETWETRAVLPALPLPAVVRDLLSSIAARFTPASHHLGSFVPGGQVGAIAIGTAGVLAALTISGQGVTEGPETVAEQTPAQRANVATKSLPEAPSPVDTTRPAEVGQASTEAAVDVPVDSVRATSTHAATVPSADEGQKLATADAVEDSADATRTVTDVLAPVGQLAGAILEEELIQGTLATLDEFLGAVTDPVLDLLPELQ